MIMIEGTALKVAVVLRSENQREKKTHFSLILSSVLKTWCILLFYIKMFCVNQNSEFNGTFCDLEAKNA